MPVRYRYDYKVEVAPQDVPKDALTKPMGFTAFVYNVSDRDGAARAFWARHMVIARKNGIQRGKNAFADNMTITRIASHKLTQPIPRRKAAK